MFQRLLRLIYFMPALLIACSADPVETASDVVISKTPADISKNVEFWDTPQRGANSFNAAPPDKAYFKALKETGATWVRLTFSKWDGDDTDFLIGNIDAYRSIPKGDLATLMRVLDDAHAAGLKVVVVPLSLPGSRWKQLNDDKFDDRLWLDKIYWEQSAQFWADLSRALRGHPAIAAYNIVNEPSPEKPVGLIENGSVADNDNYVKTHAGTARDLPGFYNFVIAAIREIDNTTPIMVDAGYYANPLSLAAWPAPLKDDNILYAVHVYEPYEATSYPNIKRKVKLRYPGTKSNFRGEKLAWNKDVLSYYIGAAFDWAEAQNIPAHKIVISEFGCVRTWPDCGAYLTDVLDILDQHSAHWAYYTFRPDEWDAMDYELPLRFKSGQYYWWIEQGRKADMPRDGKLMNILKARLKQ